MPKYESFTNFKFPVKEGGDIVANVIFTGSLSGQVAPQNGTIKITKPDNTIESITVTTDIARQFTVTKQYTTSGTYKAQAIFDADTDYIACSSPEVTFIIQLQSRTVTLTVSMT